MRSISAPLVAIVTAFTASELFAQERVHQSGVDQILSRLADEPALLIPLAGIACGMLAILVFGLAAVISAIRGDGTNEEVIDRLDTLDDRMADLESAHRPTSDRDQLNETAGYRES